VHDSEDLREHYRLTLNHWHDRLWENHGKAVDIAGEELSRIWLLYLSIALMGFERGVLHIYQTLVSKRRLGLSGLPPTREDIYEARDGTVWLHKIRAIL